MRRRDDNFPDNGFEAWGGYMQAKISKLEEQFTSRAAQDEKPLSNIFNGISIYVNGYTKPSADELKSLMAKHGGVYHTYQRQDDYIIASNLPDAKVKKMSLARVVTPNWITDSLIANRLLDYREYLLYKASRTQGILNFNNETKIDKSLLNSKANVDSKVPIEIPTASFTSNEETTSKLNIELDKRKSNEGESKKTDYAKTAVDPNFISEFYSNSRLHHISQLGACFKQYINELRESSNFLFPAREKLLDAVNSMGRTNSQQSFAGNKVIMHIDMDCFFVSVGLRNRPELRGQPVAVTHSKGSQPKEKRAGVDRNTEFNLYRQKQAKKLNKLGVVTEFETRVDKVSDEGDKYGSMSEIASCSYEARAKGLKNGMFMGATLRLCPELKTIPYDFEGYKEVAYTLYNTIAQYTLDIEAVSCDEMYVDCTEILKSLNISAQDFATALRNEIKMKTGCPCSTGFGGNRLQARLATKQAKPDGQFFLLEDLVHDFMFDIKLKDLPGVGRQTSRKLEVLGHETCGSLQSLSLNVLQQHLGIKTGLQLFDQCRGNDPNPLNFQTVRKSVSAEVNYGIRFENNDQCYEFLKQLSKEVHTRMLQFKVLGKCITLKLMVRAEEAPVETAKFMGHGFCDVINKSVTLNNPTNDPDVIAREVIFICKKQNVEAKEMRGIGIQITKLESLTSKPIRGALNKFLTHKKNDEDAKSIVVNPGPSFKEEQSIKIENDEGAKSRTPKKSPLAFSPMKKKSPLIGAAKSPTLGKRRGRPPKSSKVVHSRNLISNFLSASTKDQVTFKEETFEEEIREIEKVYEKVKPLVKEPEKVGLIGFSWQKVREFLRAWLESGELPLPRDVDMIVSYLREMVVSKDLEHLNILMNFLRRRIKEMDNDVWFEVFNDIVEQVQNAMIAIYGKKLFIPT